MRNAAATGSWIVVGTDGSDHAATAVRWAAEEAVRRGAALEVIHAWLPPYPVLPTDLYADHEPMQRAAEAFVNATVERLRQDVPELVEVRGSARMDRPAPALLCAAMGAELLVVGSRGRGGFAALVLGSVSERCLIHAPCPVAVVPASAGTSHMVASSWASTARRRPSKPWRGPREAQLREARLNVVHAWTMPEVTSPDGAALVEDPGALQQASRALLEDMAEGLVDERDGGPPDLLLQSVAGPAAQALMQSAAHAELLVVGARGVGGLRGVVLGSVSRHCAHHAPCPTVVVGGVPTREPVMASAARGADER